MVEPVLIPVNHRRRLENNFVVIVGGARAQPRSSDVQTAGASPDPGQPQTTSGEQLCDVDSDETVNLQTTDESDQDDGGWGDAVSQFDVQFDDKTPHIRSSLDNRAKEHDYFRLLFCNCRKSC